MRTKLLHASSLTVQWQARLGRLLHGDAKAWNDAVAKSGAADKDLWIALTPSDAVSPQLVPTLAKAAASTDVKVRERAAAQLGRYRKWSGSADVVQLLNTLLADKDARVRAAAWYSAGRIGLGEGWDAVLKDKQEQPEVQLAAAYAGLMHAQGGPPDVRGFAEAK